MMVGCFETTPFVGQSTALTIILKIRTRKHYENNLTVDMILNMKRKAQHSLVSKCIPFR